MATASVSASLDPRASASTEARASSARLAPTGLGTAAIGLGAVAQQRLATVVRLGGGALVASALDRPDAVLLELVVERARLDAQQARRLGLDAAALLVGAQDELALEILEDVGQRHLARGHGERVLAPAAAHGRRQRAQIDGVALGEDERLLDDVLELAHVAGPVVRA